MNYEKIPIGKAKNLTNQQFGKLTALYRTVGEKTPWVCQCECGNIVVVSAGHLTSGHTKSCGCYKKKFAFDDITGKHFGRLIVLEYDHSDNKGHTYWKCQCECDTIKIIRKDGLVNGSVISCGCYKNEQTTQRQFKDLSNQQFDRWRVISHQGFDKNHSALWLCECECGTQREVAASSLISGKSRSCGCVKSHGERRISELLNEYRIPFTTEQSFSDCYFADTNRIAKFDFYVNNEYLIEYDGLQHFNSGTGWNTPEKFQKTLEHDKIKNQWCQEHNIPLIRIPYTRYKDLIIDDLLLSTSQYVMGG